MHYGITNLKYPLIPIFCHSEKRMGIKKGVPLYSNLC